MREATRTATRIVLVGIPVAFFLLPLAGLVVRAPWTDFLAQVADPLVVDALLLSLQCSAFAALLSVCFGLPVAAWLAGGSTWLRTAVRILITLPMVLPPVVGGVAMLLAFGRRGIVGEAIADWFGLTFPFTTAGVVLAETYVAMPFFVLTAEGGLRSFDQRFAAAAATLGAGRWRTFRTVTIPMIAPSLRAGALVAWARALGEFGATITFAGNLAERTRTLPLAVYVALETRPETAIVLSLLLVLVSGSVLFMLRRHWFPRPMMLDARIALSRGSLRLDLQIAAGDHETVALVGPNGAGKTSCLLALAGILRLESGRIVLDGRVLDEGKAKHFLPPEQRGIGVVFQDHLLFPHLTAIENVAYGLRSQGLGRKEARARAQGWMERVGLGAQVEVRPGALSGGQAQRVALARALATEPRMLLLDEPLAAVDASVRPTLRRDLRAHLRAFPGVRLVILHEIGDAFALADRIIVVEEGRVVQTGTLAEISNRPQSRYVADLVGLNCFRGECREGIIVFPNGARLVAATNESGSLIVTVHPRAISLFRERPSGSPRNIWQAPILAVEPAIDCVRVQVGGQLPLVAEITRSAQGDLGLTDGGMVWVAVKATEIGTAPA